MIPSYAETIKLVEDNYLHWKFNMRMNIARKGLIPQIVKLEYGQISDRSTAERKTNDLRALGVIAGNVTNFNRKTLKNRLIVTKKLNNFKMEPSTRFATHVDHLTDEYKMISTVLENTPNITLAYVIQALSGVAASDESSSAGEKAFAVKKKDNVPQKKSDEERGHVAREQRLAFSLAATSAMSKSEWLVDSRASSHMTSVRDKFVSMKDLKTPVRITTTDGTKIDAVATGTVVLKMVNGTSVSLLDVLYIPEVDGSLISVSKLSEKDVVAQFSKDKCVFRYCGAKVMEIMRCGNIYKTKTVGDEVCNIATTPRKEPWAVVHARLGHIPFKRYEQLLTMADGVPEATDGVTSDAVCAGCCMGKMRADDFSRHPKKLLKSAGVLDLVHTDIMGPMQTKTPCSYTNAVTFIFKAAMENSTG
ncbi:Integrase catalytic core protein [Phytophthora palmivora]|uniref:Integrase catalytic core protein n=1 Tax=Phytophthora palmivora TaxID=4796 RepID=A0A2P4YSF4_9STRA|nr:Integrase catalytic core protein [Phytophthora palmivora]